MKTYKQIMNELKESDLNLYNEIQQEIEEEKATWGGKRTNAGRKTITGTVLKFTLRVTEKEKEFINYAREHDLDFSELMEG